MCLILSRSENVRSIASSQPLTRHGRVTRAPPTAMATDADPGSRLGTLGFAAQRTDPRMCPSRPSSARRWSWASREPRCRSQTPACSPPGHCVTPTSRYSAAQCPSLGTVPAGTPRQRCEGLLSNSDPSPRRKSFLGGDPSTRTRREDQTGLRGSPSVVVSLSPLPGHAPLITQLSMATWPCPDRTGGRLPGPVPPGRGAEGRPPVLARPPH